MTRRIGEQLPLELQLAGAGRFGGRVLWVGVAGHVESLSALGQRLAVEERPYRPHLTVARTRVDADLRPPVELLRDYAGPTWLATDIELIESHLGPRPTYETLDTWPLTTPRADGN